MVGDVVTKAAGRLRLKHVTQAAMEVSSWLRPDLTRTVGTGPWQHMELLAWLGLFKYFFGKKKIVDI